MGALTTSILLKTVVGNMRMVIGTALNSGTGGEINTSLRVCNAILLQMNHSSVMADAPAANETFPCDGSAVTIVTTNAPGGNILFVAFGY